MSKLEDFDQTLSDNNALTDTLLPDFVWPETPDAYFVQTHYSIVDDCLSFPVRRQPTAMRCWLTFLQALRK